jgi:predicted metal-dependent HD superfamily phosphohydrolase
MLKNTALLNKVEDFISQHLQNELSSNLYFHNYNHTKEVVFATIEIARHSKISNLEIEIATVAAWFHDCGYSKAYNGHEKCSCEIATVFLEKNNCSDEFIDKVCDAIMSTKYPQSPTTLIAKILCYADFFHFSRTDYDLHQVRLRNEWEDLLGNKYTDEEWKKLNCDLLTEHQYYTDYGKNVLQKFKNVNLKLMQC